MTAMDLEQIILQCYAALHRQALAILRHPSDAEDAVQTACLKAWEHYQELHDEQRCRSWLNTIVYHECMAILRRQRRLCVLAAPEEAAMHDDTETAPDALIGYWQLMDDISVMPHVCQQAFMLRYDVGYSVQTIARLLNIPRCTVSSRLHRARGMLRKQVVLSDSQPINKVS